MGALPPQPLPMHQTLGARVASDGARTLASFDGDVSLSYGQLHDQARRLAAALHKRGVIKGEPVILMMGNGPDILICFFALAHLGAVAVPVNHALRGDSLAHVFKVTKARILIVEQIFFGRVQDALKGEIAPERIIVNQDVDGGTIPGTEPYASLFRDHGPLPDTTVEPSDPWMILFTSGTTGVSKGVVLSHQQISSAAWDVVHHFSMTETSIFYTFHPLFHLNAIVFGGLAPILSHSKTVIRRAFPREKLFDDMRDCGATHWTGLPFIIRGLMSRPPRDDDHDNDFQAIMCIGLTAEDVTNFERRFGGKLLSGYGATETGLVGIASSARDSTAGRVNPRHEVRIVGTDGQDVPLGEVGEIWTRPRQPHDQMLGYYNMPEETRNAFHDGWFRTGDLGWRGGNNLLYFSDRVKESLKRRGENISTFEVETVLQKYAGVAAAAVVGYRESPQADEEVRAFVELEPGAPDIDLAALVDHCSRHLAYFMVPRFIDIAENLPRTPVGKIEKYRLKSLPLAASTFDVRNAGIIIER